MKRLVLVTSMIMFTAIAGQAFARPAHPAMEHSTDAMNVQSNMHDQEIVSGATTAPEASMHHYTGGPKFND